MINPNFFLGQPLQFGNICKVYPPKVKEILTNSNYPTYKKLFMSSQEDIEDEYMDNQLPMGQVPTPLEYIFLIIEAEPRLKDIVIEGFEFFIKEPVILLTDQKMIVVGDLSQTLSKVKSVEDLRIIKEDNFFEFQNLLRQSVGSKELEPYDPNENERVKYFKRKARYRDRIKAKNSKDGLTFGSTLAAICCMDFGLNPLNIGELSYASIPILIRYYQEKKKYEIDISSLLAGADRKKVKPQNWIRNIEDL